LILLSLFSSLDDMANLTRILAIKGAGKRFGQGQVLGELDRHADPADRLQHEPVAAQTENQGSNHQPLGTPQGHYQITIGADME
jgi:hypothetical protein